MAIFEYNENSIFYRYFRFFTWFDLAYARSYRLFEAWVVNGWFKVDLVGDV